MILEIQPRIFILTTKLLFLGKNFFLGARNFFYLLEEKKLLL